MAINSITYERAYVLGLLVGGGTITNGTFKIVMPFDKWGADPQKAKEISNDLLTKIRKIFKTSYSIDIDYDISNKGQWILKPLVQINISEIKDDLVLLNLPNNGVLLDSADLSQVKANLSALTAEYFLTGIFDSRASLTESHRRFVDSAPIVSIEIPGSTMNFKFVVGLCSWLTDLGSTTDQILYNHPCQHASSDPTYSGWKKGFKIRLLVKSFITKHSFAMMAKAKDVSILSKKQETEEQTPCNQRNIIANDVSIHDDIKSPTLPNEVRGKLFLHYHHICAAMGCPHAPLANVHEIVKNAVNHISVFPKLSKGGYQEMELVHLNLATGQFSSTQNFITLSCKDILLEFNKRNYKDIEIGLAYLLSEKLNGKRHIGSKDIILNNNLTQSLVIAVIDNLEGSPIFIGNNENDRGVLVSSVSGEANQIALKSHIKITGIDINVR